MKNILVISGSTRKNSVNSTIIQAVSDLAASDFHFEKYIGIDHLPHFNPDLDTEQSPQAVNDFRQKIKAADGVLICTPEYAMGVPGSLKNAIDWTVSSCDFSNKPVALITASSLGEKGHASLLDTLKIIEANINTDTQLLISYARSKVSADNKITDPATLKAIESLIGSFSELMNN